MNAGHKTRITLLIAVAVLAGVLGCNRKQAPSVDPEKITFAVAVHALSAPVYIAQAKGFFEREGLQVSLRPYDLGKDAYNEVMKGGADFCTVADTPLALAGVRGEKFSIIASLGDARKYARIVARKSRGIAGPKDLQRKTVALNKGTTSDYFLHAYLTFYEIPEGRVHTVDMSQGQMADALAKGTVDAAVVFPPFLKGAEEKLGQDHLTLTNERIYRFTWNVVAAQDYVKSHPETVKKVLRALVQARNYVLQNPQEAQKITDGYAGGGTVASTDCDVDVRLDRFLLTYLEEEARWAISRRLTERREVPNFLNLIYPDGLEAVAPGSVSLTSR